MRRGNPGLLPPLTVVLRPASAAPGLPRLRDVPCKPPSPAPNRQGRTGRPGRTKRYAVGVTTAGYR